MSNLINEPDAPRLINGLRDTGYNFKTAAADIIDNSIAANATQVNVRIEMTSDGRKFVFFGDNGDGMDASGVHDAMRYGAPVRANLASLGKFGLGLKTASSSVCRQFSVISRRRPEDALTKLAWDLDHVEETGLWEMRQDPITEDEKDAYDELCGEKGTLVIWSKCDRILNKHYHEPGGTKEQQAIRRLRDGLVSHISLTYHRFLDPDDARQTNVGINVDGTDVAPWNPFFPEKAEAVLPADQQLIEMEKSESDDVGTARIQAWILPHSSTLTEDQKKRANITNSGQGFYIYREGRLINAGGWLGVFGSYGTLEPHMSLLRVEFDFEHDLDEAFHIDVKKSRILLDPNLEEHLKSLLSPARREAENRYRRTEKKRASEASINHGPANISISGAKNTKKPMVQGADATQQVAVVTNNLGSGITIRPPIQNNVRPDSIHVEAVDDITTGELWQAALRSTMDTRHEVGVLLNKHHDFYQKIYLRAASSGYSVEGMDLLLWALASAELNNTNDELAPIFRDIREEVSSNLRKLLDKVPVPKESDLSGEGSDQDA